MKCLIGEWIQTRGFKKNFVATQLGITNQQLSNWIGGRSYPPMIKAFKLAALLNCKVDDLYERVEENKEK